MEQKRCSSTMIFVNSQNAILVYLRDNKPGIRCPNMWDLIGGHSEGNENPEQTILRELSEELPGIEVREFKLYRRIEFPDRIDSIFWTRVDVPIDVIRAVMTEGKRSSASWVTAQMAEEMEFGFGFNSVVRDFFLDLNAGQLA